MSLYFRSMLRKAAFLIAAGFVSLALVRPAAAASKPTPAKTVGDLRTACRVESNARSRYLAFAQKADQEGFGEVASLFRAAAKAEEIHAASHAAVILKLGDEPKADIVEPEVKTTKENLQDALAGEVHERDVMYPEYIEEAKTARNTDALRTFRFAIKAEAEHARMYQEALEKLPRLTKPSRKYYVCMACGFTTENLNFQRCLVCGEEKEKYVAVS